MRVIRTRTVRKINSPEVFFNSLCARFPNYYGVLLEMGWDEMEIPMDKDELPKSLLEAYERVEVKTHAYLTEQLYKAARRSPKSKDLSGILKTMDTKVISKKDDAKEAFRRKGEVYDPDVERPDYMRE